MLKVLKKQKTYVDVEFTDIDPGRTYDGAIAEDYTLKATPLDIYLSGA